MSSADPNKDKPEEGSSNASSSGVGGTSDLTSKGKENFTLGGVKKPKFKPVMKKTASTNKPVSFSTMDPAASNQLPQSASTNVKLYQPHSGTDSNTVNVKKENTSSTFNNRNNKPGNRRFDNEKSGNLNQRRNQPRFQTLVSGESTFFGTGTSNRSRKETASSFLVMNSRSDSTVVTKKEEGDEDATNDNEFNDDQELPAADNGPIRFPYFKDESQHHNGTIGWDQDEEQVSALELLRGVVDGDLLLFSLPSFLPIYTKNHKYGIDEDAYVHNINTKPTDYVENELMGVTPGHIGKMRVHESGRISLDINGYIVNMNLSVPLHYQQQVVTIDENTKSLNILGDITHRLVLTPDMQNYQ